MALIAIPFPQPPQVSRIKGPCHQAVQSIILFCRPFIQEGQMHILSTCQLSQLLNSLHTDKNMIICFFKKVRNLGFLMQLLIATLNAAMHFFQHFNTISTQIRQIQARFCLVL